jgi:hypothetical protein
MMFGLLCSWLPGATGGAARPHVFAPDRGISVRIPSSFSGTTLGIIITALSMIITTLSVITTTVTPGIIVAMINIEIFACAWPCFVQLVDALHKIVPLVIPQRLE